MVVQTIERATKKFNIKKCGYHYCSKSQYSYNKWKKCSRCKNIRYCSKTCQKKHWPEHKVICV